MPIVTGTNRMSTWCTRGSPQSTLNMTWKSTRRRAAATISIWTNVATSQAIA